MSILIKKMKKTLEILKRHKIVVVFGLIVLTVALLVALPKSKKEDIQPVATPPTVSEFRYLRKIPESGEIKSIWGTEPLTFVFNKPIDPNSIIYAISPQVDSKVSVKPETPTQFSIIPLSGWEANTTYTISITQAAANTGQLLRQNVVTTFTRTLSPEDIQDFPDEHAN